MPLLNKVGRNDSPAKQISLFMACLSIWFRLNCLTNVMTKRILCLRMVFALLTKISKNKERNEQTSLYCIPLFDKLTLFTFSVSFQ